MTLPIVAPFQTGQILYATVRGLTAPGQVWNANTLAFEAYNSSRWAQYAVPMAEQAPSGFYSAAYPSQITGVLTCETIYQQGGGSPAPTDTALNVVQSQGVNLLAIAGSLAAAINMAAAGNGAVQAAAAAGTLSRTQMTTTLSASLANFYVGRTVLWTSGALAGVAAAIQGYAASGGLLTFTPTPVAPVAGDSFVIL